MLATCIRLLNRMEVQNDRFYPLSVHAYRFSSSLCINISCRRVERFCTIQSTCLRYVKKGIMSSRYSSVFSSWNVSVQLFVVTTSTQHGLFLSFFSSLNIHHEHRMDYVCRHWTVSEVVESSVIIHWSRFLKIVDPDLE